MAAAGTKTVWALTAYRGPSGDMSLVTMSPPVRRVRTQPVKSSLKSLYCCQWYPKVFGTKAKSFLFSKDEDIMHK